VSPAHKRENFAPFSAAIAFSITLASSRSIGSIGAGFGAGAGAKMRATCGARQFQVLGYADDGFTRDDAEEELGFILALIKRGTWRPQEPPPTIEDSKPEPTFHEFASKWVADREHEVEPRTAEFWRWALSVHLLPHFKDHRIDAIGIREVDAYRTAKVKAGVLSAGSINKTLKVLAQILDDAVEYGCIESNPARGKRRRLKAARPKRTWLEADEARDLLDAAGDHRSLIAVMLLAGLRVSEATSLRWRSVNLGSGALRVEHSKTDAGQRTVDLSPDLLDELKLLRATTRPESDDELVFPTSQGTPLHRANVSNRILAKAVERANAERAKVDRSAIEGVTCHSLRRTFASLLYEAGASPAYVMSQMGHTSSGLALEIYAKKMERSRDTGARMDALIRGAEWAQTGTNGSEPSAVFSSEKTKTPLERGFSRLRD
jgi:integrase